MLVIFGILFLPIKSFLFLSNILGNRIDVPINKDVPAAIKELLLMPADNRQLIDICVMLDIIVPDIDLNASHLDLMFSPKTSYTADTSVKEEVPCQKFMEIYRRNRNTGLYVIMKAEKITPIPIKNIVLCRLLSTM